MFNIISGLLSCLVHIVAVAVHYQQPIRELSPAPNKKLQHTSHSNHGGEANKHAVLLDHDKGGQIMVADVDVMWN